MVYKHHLRSNLSQFVWEKSIFLLLWRFQKSSIKSSLLSPLPLRSSEATFDENRCTWSMQTPKTTSGRPYGLSLASSEKNVGQIQEKTSSKHIFPITSMRTFRAFMAWWPQQTFSRDTKCLSLPTCKAMVYKHLMGSSLSTLELLFARFLSSWGPLWWKSDHKATPL